MVRRRILLFVDVEYLALSHINVSGGVYFPGRAPQLVLNHISGAAPLSKKLFFVVSHPIFLLCFGFLDMAAATNQVHVEVAEALTEGTAHVTSWPQLEAADYEPVRAPGERSAYRAMLTSGGPNLFLRAVKIVMKR